MSWLLSQSWSSEGSFLSWLRRKLPIGGAVNVPPSTTATAMFNMAVGVPPTNPNDGDVWRQDDTNTGLKIRINGVTMTITLS